MRNLYNLYRLQIILTVAVVMFPQGIARSIALVSLALLMLLLWIVLREAMRMEEKDEQEWEKIQHAASEAGMRVKQMLRETPPEGK